MIICNNQGNFSIIQSLRVLLKEDLIIKDIHTNQL